MKKQSRPRDLKANPKARRSSSSAQSPHRTRTVTPRSELRQAQKTAQKSGRRSTQVAPQREPARERPLLSIDLISQERSFLHDLANPLAISAGMLEALLESGSRSGQFNVEQLRKLNKAREAIQRLGDLLDQRRKFVIELQEKSRIESQP